MMAEESTKFYGHSGFTAWLLALSLSPLFFVAAVVSALHIVMMLNDPGTSCEDQLPAVVFRIFTMGASLLVIVLAIVGSFYASRKKRRRSGSGLYEILEINNGNEQALNFFTAIVIPVISLVVSSDIVAYVCFWLIVGILVLLLVKTSSCYWNPVLVACGYNLYESTLVGINGKVRIVTRNDISVGSKCELVRMSGRCFYAR